MATRALSQWVYNRPTDHKAINGCIHLLTQQGCTNSSEPLQSATAHNWLDHKVHILYWLNKDTIQTLTAVALKRRLSVANLNSENNLPTFNWMLQSPSGKVEHSAEMLVSFFPSSSWYQITSSFMQKPTEKPLKINAVGFPTFPLTQDGLITSHCCYWTASLWQVITQWINFLKVREHDWTSEQTEGTLLSVLDPN